MQKVTFSSKEEILKAIEEKTIFRMTALALTRDEIRKRDALIMDCGKRKCHMLAEDTDKYGTAVLAERFVGAYLSCIVIFYDEKNDIIYVSRKDAQDITTARTMDYLRRGKVYEGRITHLMKFGVMVQIGEIAGLLKNVDFSTDYLRVCDKYSEGDRIKVCLNKINSKGKPIFEAATKEHIAEKNKVSDFFLNEVVIGCVRNIKSTYAFVAIGDGIEGLCDIRFAKKCQEGDIVQYRVTRIDEEPVPKVHGKIVKVMR